MDVLAELQLINDYLIRDYQDKEKFLNECEEVLIRCDCGAVSQKLLDDLGCLKSRISTEEYKDLITKTLAYQGQHLTVNTDDSTSVPEAKEVSVSPLAEDNTETELPSDSMEHICMEQRNDKIRIVNMQATEAGTKDFAQIDIIIEDIPTTADGSRMEKVQICSDDDGAVRTIYIPAYSSTSADNLTESDVTTVTALKALADMSGEDGSVVIYEDGKVLEVQSGSAVSVTDLADVTVVTSNELEDGTTIKDLTDCKSKKNTSAFVSLEEEKELMQHISTPKLPDDSLQKLFQCHLCEKSYTKSCYLKQHMYRHDRARLDKYKCPFCGKSFIKSSSLHYHIKVHNGTNFVKCSVCEKKFAQRSTLTRHMKTHNKEKPYSCNICNKRFSQLSHAKTHMATHSSSRYKCHLCPRTFGRQDLFDRHLEVHKNLAKRRTLKIPKNSPVGARGVLKIQKRGDPMKRFVCRYCPEKFGSKSELQEHDESHKQDRPYQCQTCGVRCVTEASLKRHEYKHQRSKASAVCEICGKTFAYPKLLLAHLLEHDDSKSFVCEFCGDAFTNHQSLTRHRTSFHEIQRCYVCKLCNLELPSLKALRHHRTLSHAHEKYMCSVCKHSFPSISKLHKHRWNTHCETEPSSTEQEQLHKKQASDGDDQVEENSYASNIGQEIVYDKHGKPKKQCLICKKLLHPSSVYKHIKDHNANRDASRTPCTVCGVFIFKKSMSFHMRKHQKAGDIPKEPLKNVDDGRNRKACKTCGKLCLPGSLSRHEDTHLANRPFSCEVCGRGFNQKYHVTRHKLAKHPEKSKPSEDS